ncbi:sigma 54-interacting transcriptional regulator [Kordiimonas sp.]|uniref:sigma 54-interacting transcriptional regulator n=1 Tax=Kordiimonas sp. TaxID=1970157 RepID=UPI003A936DA7
MNNSLDLDTKTISFASDQSQGKYGQATILAVGIVWHPDRSRIGAVAPLLSHAGDGWTISRAAPLFAFPPYRDGSPLQDRHVSRAATRIKSAGSRCYEILPPESKMRVTVNGKPLLSPATVSLDELGGTIILTLSDEVILAIFEKPVDPDGSLQHHGMIGISGDIQYVRRGIEQAAPSGVPVLIRGETGTGKELVAAALHALSPRSSGQMLSVNMATLAPELAAAELFGVEKGAFTGATQRRAGLFEQASNGTLFLDEIGNAPEAVQPMLLRTLETGEVRRVGSAQVSRTNARIIAATDQPLESEAFSQPLLRRMERFVIEVPPLRRRRVDMGVLILHFLRQFRRQYAHVAMEDISSAQVIKLILHDWPGNVRELKNIVEQMVLAEHPDDVVARYLARQSAGTQEGPVKAAPAPRQQYRDASDVSEQELLTALDGTGWQIKEAAQQLGVSRGTLYNLMQQCPSIRRAEDLDAASIGTVMAQHPGSLDLWVKELRVGRDALKRRIKALGL